MFYSVLLKLTQHPKFYDRLCHLLPIDKDTQLTPSIVKSHNSLTLNHSGFRVDNIPQVGLIHRIQLWEWIVLLLAHNVPLVVKGPRILSFFNMSFS